MSVLTSSQTEPELEASTQYLQKIRKGMAKDRTFGFEPGLIARRSFSCLSSVSCAVCPQSESQATSKTLPTSPPPAGFLSKYGITQTCARQETLKSVAVVLRRLDDDCVSYIMNCADSKTQRY